MTDEEILNIGQKYQGRARNDTASMPGEVHCDIQALLSKIHRLKEIINTLLLHREAEMENYILMVKRLTLDKNKPL